MASISLQTKKDGSRYFLIRVSRGRGLSPYQMRFDWPKDWSEKAARRQAAKVAAQFEIDCKNGQVQSRSEKAAEAAQKAAERAKLKTVQQYYEGVYLPAKALTVSENRLISFRQAFKNYILPAIGDCKLCDVTSAQLQKLLLDYLSNHAYSSLNLLYSVLTNFFDMAFDSDVISVNPMAKVKKPARPKAEVAEADSDKALTADELNRLLQCADKEPLMWRTFLHLAADSGARRGELLGLQWSNVDWDNGTITISKNVQYSPGKGVYVTSTKTGKSRVVDIGPNTLKLLRQLQREQSVLSLWIFSEAGSLISPQKVERYISVFAKRYGFKNLHMHKLRHSSASIAITNGADILSVSRRLGHSTVSTTLNRYSHANEKAIRAAGDVVRKAIGEN